MDELYLPVLNQLLIGVDSDERTQLLKVFRETVGVIILLETPLPIASLARLLDTSTKSIRNLLDLLHSVLSVSDSIDTPVRILNLSFRDYLLNTGSAFNVEEKRTHRTIASSCLRVMNSSLKHNICGLPSYGTQSVDITRSVIDRYLPVELQYSCRYWVFHLEQGGALGSEINVFEFLRQHFLHWLEAMSLTGFVAETDGIIRALQASMRGDMTSELSEFLYNADLFTRMNTYIANIAPLQIYCSGLAFSPTHSTFREVFKEEQRWVHIPLQASWWKTDILTLEGPLRAVSSMAFSPDGRTLASGSHDKTIKLWDTGTGSKIQTLKGHSNLVNCVAFSLDGWIVASGSYDNTIKLWDTSTGSEIQTLKGHSSSVRSVAFSPDGQTVVSGSYDKSIKLWDVGTGSEIQTLNGHPSFVNSVAFSPDGRTVASGSHDKTIKLWDASTGSEIQILKGHSGLVDPVVFSPDGQIVASGSHDKTIKLWEISTGLETQTLKDYSSVINFVAFSPDGRIVASGPRNKSIKLWDVSTGSEIQTIKGYYSWVSPVAGFDTQEVESSFQISLENNWVSFKGEKVLWLPPEYRTSFCFTVKGNALALGYCDGEVSIMKFCAPQG